MAPCGGSAARLPEGSRAPSYQYLATSRGPPLVEGALLVQDRTSFLALQRVHAPKLAPTAESDAHANKRLRIDHDRDHPLHDEQEEGEIFEDSLTPQPAPSAQRPTRPLPPQRMDIDKMFSTFRYDPEDMTNLPTKRDQCPNLWRSRRGQPPTASPSGSSSAFFPDVTYSIPALGWHTLVGNIKDELKDAICRAPADYRAMVMHGGGKGFFEHEKYVHKELEDHMRAMDIAGAPRVETLRVYRPEPKNNDKGGSRSFAQPWSLFIRIPDSPLRTYLDWYRALSIKANLSGTLYPIDPSISSWRIVVLTGDAVRDCETAKAAVLVAVKKYLASNPRFVGFLASHAAAAGLAGSAQELLKQVLDTYNVVYTEGRDKEGNTVPAFVLLGEPFVREKDDVQHFLSYFTSAEMWCDMARLYVNKVTIHCDLCKSDLHNIYACDYPSTEGYLGPRNDDEVRERENEKRAAETRSRNRENSSVSELAGSSAKSKKDRAPRGGKKDSDRGWTVVQHGTKRRRGGG
ncbi:hypothetical protein GGF50DRAFT_110168 [Schizophyllum commune]